MLITTKLKLFTAVVTCPYYYVPVTTQTINIIAENMKDALAIAEEYVLEHHVILRLINNDAETIYMRIEE